MNIFECVSLSGEGLEDEERGVNVGPDIRGGLKLSMDANKGVGKLEKPEHDAGGRSIDECSEIFGKFGWPGRRQSIDNGVRQKSCEYGDEGQWGRLLRSGQKPRAVDAAML